MRIYAFGGLGVDEKVFQNFYLNYDLIVVKWPAPAPNESFKRYVNRLILSIDTTQPFILMGVSFGGMVAVELSCMLQPEKTIIISSVASAKELPIIYRWFGKMNILSWLPDSLLKPPMFIMNWLFGVSHQKDKALLSKIVDDTDIHFLRWASDKIMRWDNSKIPSNLFRIHGDKDRILPVMKVADNYVIEEAGHFMVVTHADRISAVINKKIEDKG